MSWAHVMFWWFLANGALLLWIGFRNPQKPLPAPSRNCQRGTVQSVP